MDYALLGTAFKGWSPDKIDRLPWSQRKDLLELYKEMQESSKKS